MKVIKEGKLPEIKKHTLQGTCGNCGCIVEEDYEWVVAMTIPFLDCPTKGCNKRIVMLKKHPENLEQNYV